MIGRLRRDIFALAAALAIMTRIPMPAAAHQAQAVGAAPRYFALVGLAIGTVSAGVFLLADLLFPQVVAALLSIAATLLLTGALHEDGFADCCDGLGGGATRERALEIMKDSRLGTYGVLGLFLLLGLKTAALSALPAGTAALALVCGHSLSRISIVIAMANGRYVRVIEGSTPYPSQAGTAVLMCNLAFGATLLAALGLEAVGATVGALLGHVAMRLAYERKLGGYTGDCLGAVQQLTEAGFLLGILSMASMMQH